MTKLSKGLIKATAISLVSLFSLVTRNSLDISAEKNARIELGEQVQKEEPRILVTGFKPWEGHPNNITKMTVEGLKDCYDAADNVDYVIFDVDYASVEKTLAQMDLEAYDYIIATGLSETALSKQSVLIREIQADNTAYWYDDKGGAPQGLKTGGYKAVNKGEPECFDDSSLMADLYEAYKKPGCEGLTFETDNDAGDFLCEYLHFKLLKEAAKIRENGGKTESMFFHLTAQASDTKEALQERADTYRDFFSGFLDKLRDHPKPERQPQPHKTAKGQFSPLKAVSSG